MKIDIENFYSLKKVSFELSNGISVVAGKNGSGKSQLIAAIVSASPGGRGGIAECDFALKRGEEIQVEPKPEKVLWRPPIRSIGQETLGQEFSALLDTSSSTRFPTGYVENLRPRYTQLHYRLCSIFLAGDISKARKEDARVWDVLCKSFARVFDKDLGGAFDRRGRGAKVGLCLEGQEISRFTQLSSGELEYVSLLCDFLTEPDVDVFLIDEIDAHFHPDLQKRVLDEIKQFCAERVVLVSTQSPAVMLSADPEKLFFLKHYQEVESGENQITPVVSSLELFDSVSRMYAGFADDVRVIRHFSVLANRELLQYAEECIRASEARSSANVQDYDPQVSTFRTMLLNLPDDATIVEHGVGKGRLLSAFSAIDSSRVASLNYHAVDVDASNEADVVAYRDEIGLIFREFRFHSSHPEGLSADLTVLANVLHEIGPDRMGAFLCQVLRQAKRGSKILILEALELAVGEKRFVVFDGDALTAMFSNCVEKGTIEVVPAHPTSHGGIPLLEAVVTVHDPEQASIDDEDVLRALQSTVERGARVLANSISDSGDLTARRLAFLCHNVANAAAFQRILGSRK